MLTFYMSHCLERNLKTVSSHVTSQTSTTLRFVNVLQMPIHDLSVQSSTKLVDELLAPRSQKLRMFSLQNNLLIFVGRYFI